MTTVFAPLSDTSADRSGAGEPAPEPVPPTQARDWLGCSFADALEWGAATWGEREAVVRGTERLSFCQFAGRVRAFARGLLAMGVAPGEKVALWMTDRIEWLVARWAVPAIGAVLVPVNTRLRDADVRLVLSRSDAATLVVQDLGAGADFLAILAELVPDLCAQKRGAWAAPALPALRRVIGLAAGGPGAALPPSVCRFEEVERCGADRLVAAALASTPCMDAAQFVAEAATGGDAVLRARMEGVRGGDVAQILFTAGNAAEPRGAMQGHGALLHNNAYAAECLALAPGDRYLSCVPLFTAPGTSYALAAWIAGAAIVILDEFEPALFCRMVERERITVTFFVDTLVQDLRGYPHVADHDFSSLRTGTGAPLPTASFLWITKMLGVPQLVSVYGMSEACGAVARTRVGDPLAKRSATHGRPVDGMRVRIVDLATGETLPANMTGEICIAGSHLLRGYYGQPAEAGTEPDAWLRSGDLGELDADGYLVWRGRLKDMIKPGGFNVATQEIEVFLETFPGVRDAVVVGVPDARLGEVPFAWVRPCPGRAVDVEALRAYCKAHVASYKVPRHVELLDAWPGGDERQRKVELRGRAQVLAARLQRDGRG